jgi:HD superfamily phosphohydrolase YqeK
MQTKDGTNNNTQDNLVFLADYKKKKQTQQEVKKVFKQSLDNDQVMKRYNINQPTIEERTERIKQSIQRINALMGQLK